MSHASTPRRPSRLRECTSQQQADEDDDATAQYLRELRQRRDSNRPSGSRPPPPSKFASLRRTDTAPPPPIEEHHAEEQTRNAGRPSLATSNSLPIIPAHQLSHNPLESAPRIRSPFAGRPLARPPSAAKLDQPSSPLASPAEKAQPIDQVDVESGRRFMEKRSARSVRAALEAMSMEDERKVHAAAQDEAAELVFRHKNPGAAFANPEAPYANPDRRGATGGGEGPRARAGSYQRWQRPEKAPIVEPRGMQRGSPSPSTDAPTIRKQASVDPQRTGSPPADATFTQGKRSLSGKSYGGLAEAVADDIQKAKRRTSSGSKRILSGEKKPYMHPNDRIWEDPQEEAAPKELPVVEESTKTRPAPTAVQPPSHVRKNPFARVRAQQDRLVHSNSAPSLPTAKHHSVEIQKNPPSRSRNAWYTSNEPLPPTPPPSSGQPGDEVEPKGTSPTRDGQEIRGDDIRAATSKQRKDRSANLPQPTMVSDKPGRPIVSFQTQVWEKVLEEVQTRALEPSQMDGARAQSPLRQPLASPYGRGKSPAPDSRPPIPSIVIPDEPKGRQRGGMPPIPTINLPDGPSMPTVVLPEEPGFAETSQQSAPGTPTTASVSPISINAPDWTPPSIHRPGQRPLPTPTSKHTRPLAHHSATSPLPKSSPHYTPTIRHSSALCAHCALPITGRILSAAGARFHPGCFVCHTCHTNLELVAFYPEPQNHHQNRLARLHHTTNDPSSHHHPDLNNNDPDPDIDIDNDPAQRFYCHLDFHEHFSPRCKTCQTPIEGQAIVACGAEYHEGHFFCAQCGDPFDASTPFVEKDNYAWCVGCHTNRYSEKCRKCRKPVTELVVKALGWDWHEECFVCLECHGEFVDGRYFLRGESRNPVCVRCEERRLKTYS